MDNSVTKRRNLNHVNEYRHGRLLRRRIGGRLRHYRPNLKSNTRLDAIRKAFIRGELVSNRFHRWRLFSVNNHAVGWTFADAGKIRSVAQNEIKLAKRESGELRIIEADESSVKHVLQQIEESYQRPHLIVARRDWCAHPGSYPIFNSILTVAKKHNVVVHVIATVGKIPHKNDELNIEALRYQRHLSDPLLRPSPLTSKIENRFGETLIAAGLHPIPQLQVANYFLDFGIISDSSELPIRLDIEVDGRHWHEGLPGQYRKRDIRRDRILKMFGWRPVRFWSDEIETNEQECVERIRQETISPISLAITNNTQGENP